MMETGWKGNGKREVDRRETEKKETQLHLQISGFVHSNSNTSMSVCV